MHSSSRILASLTLVFLVALFGCNKSQSSPTSDTESSSSASSGASYTTVENCKATDFDTSVGGTELYDTHVFAYSGPYLRLKLTGIGGTPRIQILNADFTSTKLSSAQVEEELKTRLVWEKRATGSGDMYPKGVAPGTYYINLYEGAGVVWIYDCSGPAT